MAEPQSRKVVFSYSVSSFSFVEEAEHFSFSMRASEGTAALEIRIPAWALLDVALSLSGEGAAFLEIEGHFDSFGPATRRTLGPLNDTDAFEALRVLTGRLPIPRAPVARADETLSAIRRHQLVITEGALRPSHIEGPNFADVRVRMTSQAAPLELERRYRITGHLAPAPPSPSPSNMGYVVGYGGACLEALLAEEITTLEPQTTRDGSEEDSQSEVLANYFAFHGIQHLRAERALWKLCHDDILGKKWLTTAHPDHWGWVKSPLAVVHPGCYRREGRLLERFLGMSAEEAGELILGRRFLEPRSPGSPDDQLAAGPAVRFLLSKPAADGATPEQIALAELFDLYMRSPLTMTPLGFPIPPRKYRSAEAESTANQLLEQIARGERLIALKAPKVIVRNEGSNIQRTLNKLWDLTVREVAKGYPQMRPATPETIPALVEAQSRLRARIVRSIGTNGRYEVDLSQRSVTWLDASGAARLSAAARAIGTWSSRTGELLCGWANPALPKGSAIEPVGAENSLRMSQDLAFFWAMRAGQAAGSDYVFRSATTAPDGTGVNLYLALWRVAGV